MNIAKLMNRHDQIVDCLRFIEKSSECPLALQSSKNFQALIAAQERLLSAAERLVEQVQRAS